MDGITTPGLVLIFVFVVLVLALATQLAYVLRYLRRFQREPPGADDPEVAAAAAAATGDPYGSPSSKELLLYFICLRNQSQNERALATVTPVYAFSPSPPGFPCPRGTAFPPDAKPLPPPPPPPLPPPLPSELTKWGDAYATEVLFAGREEGEEGEKEAVVSTEDTVVSDGEAGGKEQKEEEVMEEGGDFEFEVVPSSTPFCSSRFYTPPMSPPRGVEGGWELELSQEADGPAPDEEGFLSSEEMVPGGE